MGEADPFEDDAFEVGVEVLDLGEVRVDDFGFTRLIHQYTPQSHFQSWTLKGPGECIRGRGVSVQLRK